MNEAAAKQALEEALARYPQFAAFGPRLVARALFKGEAYMLEWSQQPAEDLADAWEFQNAAVKGYRRICGGVRNTCLFFRTGCLLSLTAASGPYPHSSLTGPYKSRLLNGTYSNPRPKGSS